MQKNRQVNEHVQHIQQIKVISLTKFANKKQVKQQIKLPAQIKTDIAPIFTKMIAA